MKNWLLSLTLLSTLSLQAHAQDNDVFAAAAQHGREFAQAFCNNLPPDADQVFKFQACDEIRAEQRRVLYVTWALVAAGPAAFGIFWLYRKRSKKAHSSIL